MPAMDTRNIIVIGASAGGFAVLRQLVADLPPNLPAALFIVWHMPPDGQGLLSQVLGRAHTLPTADAADGDAIVLGRMYVAPPDHHLLLDPGRVRVTKGPKEHRFRPAVDPLFRSAAIAYGPRVVNAEDRDHAEQAAKAFAAAYGAKWPKAVANITNDLDVLLAFYDFPGEHWIHLRTTNPIESTFATVRLRQRVAKGPGSRAAGIVMAFKLIASAQHRWRAVNSAHLVALVRAGAKFENGVLVERPDESTSGGTHAA